MRSKKMMKEDPVLLTVLVWHVAIIMLMIVFPDSLLGLCLILFMSHLLILTACLVPSSPWPGRAISALPLVNDATIYLTFDDGPDPVITEKVMAILKKHNASASFFIIGKRAKKYPEIISQMTKFGHRVENHSWSHSNWFISFSWRRLKEELEKTSDLILSIVGRKPGYFRAPAGVRGPLSHLLMANQSLHLAGWNRRGFDTVSTDSKKIVKRLVKNLNPGDILLLHDGSSAVDDDGNAVVLSVLTQLLEICSQKGYIVTHLPDAKR